MKNILYTITVGLLFISQISAESVYVSPSGDNSNTGTFDNPFQTILYAIDNESPVIKGSDIVTGWDNYDSYYKKHLDICPQQVFVDGDNPLQQVGMPSKYITNDVVFKYHPVGNDLEDMAPGRFYWDKTDSTLYVWLFDGTNPNSHVLEVSQRGYLEYIFI